MRYKLLPVITAGLLSYVPLCVHSLEAISDREMAEVSGQAFITIDDSSYNSGSGDWAGNYEFTKVNLGLKAETLVNIAEVKLGKFDRTAYEDGTVPMTDENRNIIYENGQPAVYDSDIHLNNFALGRVDNYMDGALAEFVPFVVSNPYLELAYKIEGSERRVAGFRLGFENAQGDLSADIISYTGFLEGEVRGGADIAYDKTYPDGCGWGINLNCRALALATDTEIYANIEPVDGSTGDGAPNLGVQYLKRASWFGVRNGNNFQSDESGLIAALIPALTSSDDCIILGNVDSCFPSTIYQSIYIGDKDTDFETGSASGLFVSIQTESVPWEDLSGVPGSDRVLTERGAFLNIARYQSGNETKFPLYLDLDEAVYGTPRVATCVGRIKGC